MARVTAPSPRASQEEQDIFWLRECIEGHDRTDIDGGCPVSVADHGRDIAARYEAILRQRDAFIERSKDHTERGRQLDYALNVTIPDLERRLSEPRC